MPVIDLGRVIGPQGPQGETGAQGIRGEQGLPGPNQVTNSTATPLTGVLTGNGSVVGVANIDSAPTPNSTGFATSGGTDKAIKGRVPVYGMGKNLLDNWYFVGGGSQQGGNQFPINSRGNASYSGISSAYSIDRWAFTYSSPGGSVTFDSGYITLSGNGVFFRQKLNANVLPSETYTFSMLLGDGSMLKLSGIAPTGSDSYITESGNPLSFNSYYVRMYLASGLTYNVVAAKFERGNQQTLCHNEGTDATPVWVLNDVPDYEYELCRCMTSTADSTDTFANKSLATQEQLAPIEWGTTASVRHEVGSYFCWNGLLYRTTVAIDANDPITPGTNCAVTTVGNEMHHTETVTTVSVAANTDTVISITPPTGFTMGLFVGVYGSSDWSAITIKTIASQGVTYPNRVKVNSTSAQSVSVRILWIK